MRKNSSDFKTSFVSEAGTYVSNKDYFAYMELDDYACFVVADGIDSDEEISSAEVAVKSIFEDFSKKPTLSRRKIKNYLKNAQIALSDQGRIVRLKTSLIVVVTNYSRIVWAVSGNARMYLFRNGRINLVSKDQSMAQTMAKAGKIDATDVDHNAEKNNLTNYLGKPENFKPFISRKYKLCDGDVILLCSAGFWQNVERFELPIALQETKEPEEFVQNLEEALLANQEKIIENYTAAAVFVNKAFKENNKDKIALAKKIAMISLIVIVVIAAIIIFKIRYDKKQANLRSEMIKYENSGDQASSNGDFDKALKDYQGAEGDLKQLRKKDKQKELDDRCKITQLVLDGDKNYKAKDYKKALSNYNKAKSAADKEKGYDETEIKQKISDANNMIKILELEKQGDKLLNDQKLNDAKGKYEAAKKIADDNSFQDVSKDAASKLDNINSQISDLDKKNRTLQGNDLEKQGDDAFTARDYSKALQCYESAQGIYQELNNLQGVLSIQSKIENVQKQLNPVVPAQAAPAAETGTSGSTAAPAQPSSQASSGK